MTKTLESSQIISLQEQLQKLENINWDLYEKNDRLERTCKELEEKLRTIRRLLEGVI